MYENGSFYEIYGVDNEKEKVGCPKKISEILNITLTRKNKKILENNRSNPLLVGVPTISIRKHLKTLIYANFTVVFVEQITSPPDPKRAITRTVSPTTYIAEEYKQDTNYLISVYFESYSDLSSYQKKNLMAGLTAIDLTTGDAIFYQIKSIDGDMTIVFEDIYRFIEVFDPKELLINCSQQDIYSYQQIREKLELDKRMVMRRDEGSEDIGKLTYQNMLLGKIFKDCGNLTPVEFVNMEMFPVALVSYIILLRFIGDHDEKILKYSVVPELWDYKRHLILNHNTLYQLNIVPDSTLENPLSVRSLFDILNKTSTLMGKRKLRNYLLNPIVNSDILNQRYDILDIMIRSDKKQKLEQNLKTMIDLERFIRKMGIGYLHPHEMASLEISLENINELVELIDEIYDIYQSKEKICLPSDKKARFGDFFKMFFETFEVSIMATYNINNISQSFFKKGVNEELDKLQDQIEGQKKIFYDNAKYLSGFIDDKSAKSKPADTVIKCEQNERDGYYLATTKKRKEHLEKKLPKDHSYEFKASGANAYRIYNKEINKASVKRVELESSIGEKTKHEFLRLCEKWYEEYYVMWNRIVNFISEVDVILSNAKCAVKNNYCRPIIEENGEHSYLSAKGMRHPIIERIQTTVDYIPNDVKLNQDGMLLYGLNGGGKSSLLKSVGLSVVMAQMGMYVPCAEFRYYPFKTLYTRIMGNDNIFKGQSSFTIEMSELRTILKYANENSIILGDEICRGTEIDSAQSIVASTICILCEKKTNFLFATHLHGLSKVDDIQEIRNLKHYYIDLEIENGRILYGRKIKEGVGKNLYGLEVAESIIGDSDFIKLANKIRKKIMGEDDTLKKSTYNRNIFVESCAICESKSFLEVHHIKSQKYADENGMIGNIHKNSESNLVVLCREHHHQVHHDKIVIEGYEKTSEGNRLKYYFKEAKNKKKIKVVEHSEESLENVEGTSKNVEEEKFVHISKKKYSYEQINEIKKYKHLTLNYSIRNVKNHVDKKMGINIGITILKKIFNDEY